MANINMDIIKELRERTGVGIMDCKKALQETDGDMDKARLFAFLKKKVRLLLLKKMNVQLKKVL